MKHIYDPKVKDEKAKASLPIFSVRLGHDGPDAVHAATEERAERVFRDYYGIIKTTHVAEINLYVEKKPEPEKTPEKEPATPEKK